ncbi:TRAP transporter substrate-binding protein [Aliamphritea ceti]|uniref:TRAP transporter substrate-binding protein n=1 Tax=Aliamphritea ceti TaxID=1524258 RepID=UPI0021C30B14|nr:TRAP transporter substrate-binding protein [Aliamphritea ceti]
MKTTTKSLLLSCALFCASPLLQATEYKIALGGGQGGSQHALASKFVSELEKNTDAKSTAKMFYNSQLGSEQDTINDAALGVLDFSVVAINNITPFSPSVGVFTLPYMIQSLDEAVELTNSPAAQQLVDNTIRDAGVRIIGWTFSGFRVLTNSKHPVANLNDLQDLVIRVPKNEIMIDTYKAWGINPTPMAWSELFTALQQQVVDGQDLSLVDIESVKFNEVQTYISNIHYNFLLEPMIMSESIYQDQPEDVQAAILAAGKAATLHSADFLRDKEASAKANLLSKGMQWAEVDEAEWISKATSEVWPKYYDSVGGKDKINNVLRALGREEI